MPPKPGRFVVLDGPDGGGKTTQLALLRSWLEAEGWETLVTREPGGTEIGESIRDILLDPKHTRMSVRTELFLYMASRAQLVEEVIRPALEAGKFVLSDRFLASSVVYQGIAGGLGAGQVEQVGQLCIGDVQPELTIILDVDLATSVARRQGRPADRIEQRDADYHQRMRDGYLELARSHPDSFRVVQAAQPVDAVHETIKRLII